MKPARKRLLLVSLSCGGAVLLVALVVVLPLRSAAAGAGESADQARRILEKRLASSDFHGERDLDRSRQELKSLEQSVTTLAESVALADDPAFTVRDDASDRLIVYSSAVESVKQALRKLAAGRDVAMPDALGFPEGEVPGAEIPSLLRRLQVVDRVLRLAMELGVRAILSVAPRGDKEDERTDAVLEREAVTLELQTGFDPLLRLVHALGQKGAFLEVRKLVVDGVDPEKDVLKAKLVVAGLRVRLEAPPPEEEGSPRGGGSGGGGGKKPAAGGTWRPGR
ncbi:MAG: hypothetical protein HYZ53_26170 [Planctomycetes bacterium]|nr:hypothetical protein [Planctomycetota bacterium]